MIYPQKLNSREGDNILKILIITSVVLGLLLILINKLTSPKIPWAGFANCGIIYIWIITLYSIKRNTNIAGHVLLQIIILSIVLLYIDYRIGFYKWSISIAIPIILIVANVTMLILTIISCRKYIRYAIYELVIVGITLTSIFIIMKNFIGIRILNYSTVTVSIFNLIISLFLSYKDIKEAIIRNFHM